MQPYVVGGIGILSDM